MKEQDVNGHPTVNMGDVLTCAETGGTFIAARDGCSVNYAWRADHKPVSDKGVDIAERRALLDRSKPFFCYVASDGQHVTGWKGNVLGDAVAVGDSPVFYGRVTCYRVTDVHGGRWYGRGNPGMCITLRPCKS